MKGWAHPLLRASLFGEYGGEFVPDLLAPALDELRQALEEALYDPLFIENWRKELHSFAGRPTAITEAPRLARKYGLKNLYLKREDLVHGGAHKLNNVLGQAFLAVRLGKKELIAETGAGQHGVATAIVGARFGIPVRIFQGEKDLVRQAPNADRMRLLGATLEPVASGSKTLKDAVNETFRYWMSHYQTSFYVIGSAVGPAPFPQMVSQFQSIISEECVTQMADPDAVIACVGGGSNAIGGFLHYIDRTTVRLLGAEPEGGASLGRGEDGIFHGMKTRFLQDQDGQIQESQSLSAGLDYPAVSPIHRYLQSIGRATYLPVSDAEALSAANDLTREEGILPALESAHAIALAKQFAKEFSDKRVLVILSGRGDKDLDTYRKNLL